MTLDRPVHAPETADATTEPAVAAPAAPWTAVRGGVAQMFTPPPPPPRILGPGSPGVGHDRLPASCAPAAAACRAGHLCCPAAHPR